jgi:histidinol phosphatase-like PHP family hydrolase
LILENILPGKIDLHLHAGQERDQPIDTLVQDFVDHGITFLGLLDHTELYLMGDDALKAKFGQLVYHNTPQGLQDFYRDVEVLAEKHAGEASIFKGMELPEWEILTTDAKLLERADFLGCHMNTSCHDPTYRHYVRSSCGEHLTTRANQLLEVCIPMGKPAVLFHPFHRRVQELCSLVKDGGDLGSKEVFTEEDVDYLVENVEVEHLYVELNFGDIYHAATNQGIIERLGKTCKRLREGGIGFSLGSDYHRTPDTFRNPETEGILSSLGVGSEDFTIVNELI